MEILKSILVTCFTLGLVTWAYSKGAPNYFQKNKEMILTMMLAFIMPMSLNGSVFKDDGNWVQSGAWLLSYLFLYWPINLLVRRYLKRRESNNGQLPEKPQSEEKKT